MPSSAWPISYEELAEKYQEVERQFRIVLPRQCLEKRLYDARDMNFRQRLATVLPFWRKNFARTLGGILLGRSNVAAFFDAGNVVSVIAGSDDLEALEFESGLRVPSGRFIVAAGVVNTNLIVRRLLVAKGRDSEFPSLGRGFHDHISIPLFSIRPASNYAFSRRFSYGFARTLMFAEHYEAERRVRSGAGAFLHFTFELSGSSALRALKEALETLQRGRPTQRSLPLSQLLASPATMAKLLTCWWAHRALYIPEGVKITAALDLEQAPVPDWCLSERDGLTTLAWDIHQRDLESARGYAIASDELLRTLSGEEPFSYEPLFPHPVRDPDGFGSFVHQTATDTYHGSGGLRMGRDPRESVVSTDLALHGLKNVFALSTAVFPRVGAANPTLTLLALAQRLADHLVRT
jgi:hypothetical protein